MVKKECIKRNLVCAVFWFILILTIWYLNGVLRIRSMHGSSQAIAMYYQPYNTIDVLMLGSSHIHCDVNTGVLWSDFGIAAYDYSAAEQPLWTSYYYLKECCKYQKPKLVVLDLYSPARFKEEYQYEWLNENLCGIRFSINKLQMLLASCEFSAIDEYFPSFFVYHNRYTELTAEDFTFPIRAGKELKSFKGFTPFWGRNEQAEPALTEKSIGGLTAKSEEYLEKIIEYTENQGIELFLIVSPYITTDEDETVYNRIREIADYYEIDFNSTNYHYDEIGIDFDQDFNDPSHLNYWGACKFSRYLGNEIRKRFNDVVPDRRGNEHYDSWEINTQSLTEEAMEHEVTQ